MKRWKIIIPVVAMIAGLNSCDDSGERDFNRDDEAYFPMETGNYHIYDVEEIRWVLSAPETLRYEIKQVVADSFVNDEAGITYVFHRLRRMPGESGWTPTETWSGRIRHREVIVSRGNVPYVVLNFPLEKGMSWNGNSYNMQIDPFSQENADIYHVIDVRKKVIVNDNSYDDCVLVDQSNEEDLILYRDVRQEVYARGTGLVSRFVEQFAYCNNEGRGCVGQQLIDEGIRYSEVLKAYGKE